MQQIGSVGKGCIAAEKHGRDRVFKADKLARLVLPQCYLHGHKGKGQDNMSLLWRLGISRDKFGQKEIVGRKFFSCRH